MLVKGPEVVIGFRAQEGKVIVSCCNRFGTRPVGVSGGPVYDPGKGRTWSWCVDGVK